MEQERKKICKNVNVSNGQSKNMFYNCFSSWADGVRVQIWWLLLVFVAVGATAATVFVKCFSFQSFLFYITNISPIFVSLQFFLLCVRARLRIFILQPIALAWLLAPISSYY